MDGSNFLDYTHCPKCVDNDLGTEKGRKEAKNAQRDFQADFLKANKRGGLPDQQYKDIIEQCNACYQGRAQEALEKEKLMQSLETAIVAETTYTPSDLAFLKSLESQLPD